MKIGVLIRLIVVAELAAVACGQSPPATQPARIETVIHLPDTPTAPPPTPQPSNTSRPTATPLPTRTPVIVTTAPPSATLKPANTQKPAATIAPTQVPKQKAQPTKTVAAQKGNCSPAYPKVCIPPPPPDLDCKDIKFKRFKVLPPDPHHFDSDGDGIGCET